MNESMNRLFISLEKTIMMRYNLAILILVLLNVNVNGNALFVIRYPYILLEGPIDI